MPEVITDPTVALLALVNQGALNAFAGSEHLYFGRYALQQIVSTAAVRELIAMGHAEGATDDTVPVVYPTLLGLEAANKLQEPLGDEVEVFSAVLGSRVWERAPTITTPVVGLFLSQSQVSSLVRMLASAKSKASTAAGTLVWAAGGVVPPQLAIQLEGEALPDAGTLEFMSVPVKFRAQTNSLRRFRFFINVDNGDEALLIHMGAGPHLRFLASTSQASLLAVLAKVHPGITADDSYLALEAPHGGAGTQSGDVIRKPVS